MEISQFARPSFLDPQDRGKHNSQALAAPAEGTKINPTARVRYSTQQKNEAAPQDSSTLGTLFDTVVDTVNPLQHIPGVSTAYQAATNDTMNPIASMAGGFLFGGPVGLIAGAASSFLELVTGKTLGQNAMALLGGADEKPTADSVQTAYVSGSGEALGTLDTSLSLEQYQTFANAAKDQHMGTGARAQDVEWASRSWATQSLKQAAGTHEGQQNSGPSTQDRTNRFI